MSVARRNANGTIIKGAAMGLRIAIIGARGIPHTYAGAEELVRHLAPELVKRGHEVTVYCRAGHFKNDRDPDYQGVHRVFLPTIEHKIFGQLIHATLASFHCALNDFDIVYVHCLPSVPPLGLPWLLGRKIVVNVDGMEWANPKWPRWAAEMYFRPTARLALLYSPIVVTDAEGMRKIYLKNYRRDSVVITYGGDIVQSEHPEVVERYGVRPHDYYLIMSRFVPSNNADVIVKAFERVQTNRKLLVCGGGSYGSQWAREVKATTDPRIIFAGHVGSPEHVQELHTNCYAYIHGHSLGGTNPALVKAIGCGNCVIAHDTEFNREVLVNNAGEELAVFWKRDVEACAQKVQLVENNPELAECYRQMAHARCREAYSWKRITDQFETLFQEVVNGKPLPEIRRQVTSTD
jgi:glycosyltransferase involved in cell wall biosynthesis